ncbi:acyl-CoA carboxylase subunit beta [Corynebacterium phocae]|uniref:Acyl-CoA carboxylase subunit beta n=1 Tax=Corynebacterium phocae TaxID=161895 RepID=A0A1L7D4Q9_9CORY|nr:carboxyl transferase domain-containing protein [Corynebacterium phocae]APT93128.1 acyl-CoA carboxylase subunit beta [Corynebacterium phocae]KAA8722203.1 acyl-CoA carboxylase subunit beta [Corynebacterium phocae]
MSDMKTTAGKIEALDQKLAQAHKPLGQVPAARERIESTLDKGSFVETDALARHRSKDFGREHDRPFTDGVITGYGTIDGRKVCIYSQDATIFDGTMGEAYGDKLVKLYDLALKTGVPMVAIVEGGAPRAQEGIITLAVQARILERVTKASGLIPQITVVHGQTPSLIPGMSDIVIGAGGHTQAEVREVLSFLPANNHAETPRTDSHIMRGSIAENISEEDRQLDSAVHDDMTVDLTEVVAGVFTESLELQAAVTGVYTGFGRIEGRAVGVIANRGTFDDSAATKAAQFIQMCDCFNLPILEFVDAPVLAASPAALGKLAHAYSAATVGKVTINVGRALGNAYVVFGSKDLGADLAYAWPTAQIAVADAPALAQTLGIEDASEYLTPYQAAERGLVDAVITPGATRAYLTEALRLLERKVIYSTPKKHGNITL